MVNKLNDQRQFFRGLKRRDFLSGIIALSVTLPFNAFRVEEKDSKKSHQEEPSAVDKGHDDGNPGEGNGREVDRGDKKRFNFSVFEKNLSGYCSGLEAGQCTQDYVSFIDKNVAKYGSPRSEEDVQEIVSSREKTHVYSQLPDLSLIQRQIIQGVNIDFLINNIDKTPHKAYIINRRQEGDFVEEHIVFEDPFLGMWEALLLKPAEGFFPGIIGLHGHVSSPAHFRDRYLAKRFLMEGFAVILPSLRSLDGGGAEHAVSKKLFYSGFSFLGCQFYETLIASKFLKYLNEVDGKRIGLIGHSGGGAVSVPLPYISRDVKAVVTDHFCNYFEDTFEKEAQWFHEFAPALYPFNEVFRKTSNAGMPAPILAVPYNSFCRDYVGSSSFGEILDHFNRHLK